VKSARFDGHVGSVLFVVRDAGTLQFDAPRGTPALSNKFPTQGICVNSNFPAARGGGDPIRGAKGESLNCHGGLSAARGHEAAPVA